MKSQLIDRAQKLLDARELTEAGIAAGAQKRDAACGEIDAARASLYRNEDRKAECQGQLEDLYRQRREGDEEIAKLLFILESQRPDLGPEGAEMLDKPAAVAGRAKSRAAGNSVNFTLRPGAATTAL